MKEILVTARGLHILQERLTRIETDIQVTQADKGNAAEVGGDAWHDNFAFEQLENTERQLRIQRAELALIIGTARLADTTVQTETVAIGHRVRITPDGGTTRDVEIAGYGESQPALGIASYDSPLGAALLGARVGEKRSYPAAGKIVIVTIEALSLVLTQDAL